MKDRSAQCAQYISVRACTERWEVRKMKITFECTPKEIAALVLAVQERQGSTDNELLDKALSYLRKACDDTQ